MPITIQSVFGFIPITLCRPLKKFATQRGTVVFDLPFKMSTKYTPALLIVMLCLSLSNQFVRNIEFNCWTHQVPGKISHNRGHDAYSSNDDVELNDFCWNHETFLVVRALEPNMRGLVTYPGVSGYNKITDELLKQRYYKYVWLIFGILTVITYLPYFFWKARSHKKIKPLVDIIDSEDYSEEDVRINYFLDTIGFNESFAWFYVAFKILATLSPFVQWYISCGFLGGRFKYYGIDVVSHFLDDSIPWPDPMDVLFPKVAKCEWTRYGFGGDIEEGSTQCQLPMNNITQWSFFIYWFWIVPVFIINMLSLPYLLIHIFPSCRRYKYRKFVGAACRDDVEKLLNYTALRADRCKKKHDKNTVIDINLGFGDWIVLTFIKINLEDWEFREFIRKLATTKNRVIQLKPVATQVLTISASNDKNAKKNPDDIEGCNVSHMEIGFKKSVINEEENQNHEIGFKDSLNENCDIIHPSDSTHETGSTDLNINESTLLPSQDQYSVKITTPVKVDRKILNKTSNNGKTSNKKNEKEDNGWEVPGGSKDHDQSRNKYYNTNNW